MLLKYHRIKNIICKSLHKVRPTMYFIYTIFQRSTITSFLHGNEYLPKLFIILFMLFYVVLAKYVLFESIHNNLTMVTPVIFTIKISSFNSIFSKVFLLKPKQAIYCNMSRYFSEKLILEYKMRFDDIFAYANINDKQVFFQYLVDLTQSHSSENRKFFFQQKRALKDHIVLVQYYEAVINAYKQPLRINNDFTSYDDPYRLLLRTNYILRITLIQFLGYVREHELYMNRCQNLYVMPFLWWTANLGFKHFKEEILMKWWDPEPLHGSRLYRSNPEGFPSSFSCIYKRFIENYVPIPNNSLVQIISQLRENMLYKRLGIGVTLSFKLKRNITIFGSYLALLDLRFTQSEILNDEFKRNQNDFYRYFVFNQREDLTFLYSPIYTIPIGKYIVTKPILQEINYYLDDAILRFQMLEQQTIEDNLPEFIHSLHRGNRPHSRFIIWNVLCYFEQNPPRRYNRDTNYCNKQDSNDGPYYEYFTHPHEVRDDIIEEIRNTRAEYSCKVQIAKSINHMKNKQMVYDCYSFAEVPQGPQDFSKLYEKVFWNEEPTRIKIQEKSHYSMLSYIFDIPSAPFNYHIKLHFQDKEFFSLLLSTIMHMDHHVNCARQYLDTRKSKYNENYIRNDFNFRFMSMEFTYAPFSVEYDEGYVIIRDLPALHRYIDHVFIMLDEYLEVLEALRKEELENKVLDTQVSDFIIVMVIAERKKRFQIILKNIRLKKELKKLMTLNEQKTKQVTHANK